MLRVRGHVREVMERVRSETGVEGTILRRSGSGHYICSFNGVVATLSASPSDSRTILNEVANVRRGLKARGFLKDEPEDTPRIEPPKEQVVHVKIEEEKMEAPKREVGYKSGLRTKFPVGFTPQSFGQKLKEWRKTHSVSIREVAEFVTDRHGKSISRAGVDRIERGWNTSIGSNTLEKLETLMQNGDPLGGKEAPAKLYPPPHGRMADNTNRCLDAIGKLSNKDLALIADLAESLAFASRIKDMLDGMMTQEKQ